MLSRKLRIIGETKKSRRRRTPAVFNCVGLLTNWSSGSCPDHPLFSHPRTSTFARNCFLDFRRASDRMPLQRGNKMVAEYSASHCVRFGPSKPSLRFGDSVRIDILGYSGKFPLVFPKYLRVLWFERPVSQATRRIRAGQIAVRRFFVS